MQSLPITQLSNSSLDRFEACPLTYYHRYMNPDKPKQEGVVNFYAQYGSLMHFFAEYYPRTNFYRDIPFTVSRENNKENIHSYMDSYGNRLMEREQGLTLKEMLAIYEELFPMIEFPTPEKKNEYYSQGLTFIFSLPDMDWSKVVGIETAFKIDLIAGLPPLIGFIDKVERDENGLIVTDYKTSKPYSKNAIMQKSQLQKYGMACYFLFGEIPHTYRYHFTRFNKIAEVSIPLEDLTRVKNTIHFQFMKMLHYRNSGNFPAQYQEFYCKNFCGYSRLCPTFQAYNS
ncbi:RecB family exonuclease [Brevibacillus phage SecTim467]|uniref:RecB family exonuclease n=2 Tax=Jenstvirus jenst TaxID=1982225 RepID=A0A0K2CNP9_9CAUD|nr:putative RecB family exonuclease [Brevibacillus phage Jenst]ALA07238.1 putative RecB family exonuclease [Brevibacillus phage Jenst]ALA07452.1 RecB family exonuclease [Brevibacillus phage SecTim467]